MRASEIRVIDAGEPFPIFADQTEEYRLDKRHLVIRSPEHVATFRIKAELLRALREFLTQEEVLEVTPPVLTGNPAEGGAEAFQVDYFGRPGTWARRPSCTSRRCSSLTSGSTRSRRRSGPRSPGRPGT